jgi:ubiquinone/menaquinone biosynthesis C-methylase UbiE
MPENGRHQKVETQGLYDRIADVHNLSMKINGYRTSVAKYLRSLDLNIGPESLILDAGSGTGVTTLALLDAGFLPQHITALDLSFNSLKIAREEFAKRSKFGKRILSVQGNILGFPFSDNTFGLVLMCGVLEYTPLDDGLREAARVMKKGAPLVLLPVKHSLVGSVLTFLYNFEIHKLGDVRVAAEKYFEVVGNHEFPAAEPIGWSKTIFLLKKK